jgi:hypothetical protein
MKNILIAVCLSLFSTQSFSQAINERWIGTWQSEIPQWKPFVITQSIFEGCRWGSNRTDSKGKCMAYYDGVITKKHMLNSLNADQTKLNQRGNPKNSYEVDDRNTFLRAKKNLNQISDDTFKKICIQPEAGAVGDGQICYFLDKEYIYSIWEYPDNFMTIIQYHKIN